LNAISFISCCVAAADDADEMRYEPNESVYFLCLSFRLLPLNNRYELIHTESSVAGEYTVESPEYTEC
jgi:hypothetical protein